MIIKLEPQKQPKPSTIKVADLRIGQAGRREDGYIYLRIDSKVILFFAETDGRMNGVANGMGYDVVPMPAGTNISITTTV